MTERLRKILLGKKVKAQTADEMAVATAIENAGKSGGEGFPDVTQADNGKVLGVVNGDWNKYTLPVALHRVNATVDMTGTPTITTDSSFAAAYNAATEGKFVIILHCHMIMGIEGYDQYTDIPLEGLSVEGTYRRLMFAGLVYEGSGVARYVRVVFTDNSIDITDFHKVQWNTD